MEITHSAEIASVAGLQRYLQLVGIELNEFDSEISYLPLAHIFDRQVSWQQPSIHKLMTSLHQGPAQKRADCDCNMLVHTADLVV